MGLKATPIKNSKLGPDEGILEGFKVPKNPRGILLFWPNLINRRILELIFWKDKIVQTVITFF